MKFMKTSMQINKIQRFFKKNGSTILSVAASLGVVGTSILSAKATYDALKAIDKKQKCDADKKEKLKIAIVYYIPTILVGTITIACILSSDILNKKRQASLASALALIGESFRSYKEKVKELQGKEFHNSVISNIASKNYPDWENPDNLEIFYDSFSKRFFYSTMVDVINAVLEYNKQFMIAGSVEINAFYSLLGIDPIKGGNEFGFDCWYMAHALDVAPWIDVTVMPAMDCSGKRYSIIDFPFGPFENYMDYDPSD